MKLTVDFEREDDGRWIAEVRELPGVMVYGRDKADAFRKVGILALRVVADRLEHGESVAGSNDPVPIEIVDAA
jgi:predicted RNase H-like HicB family nuclease